MSSKKEKLVRDRMPEICLENAVAKVPGWTPMNFRMVKNQEEHLLLLLAKMEEEIQELRVAIFDPFGKRPAMLEEFADVAQCLKSMMEITECIDEAEVVFNKKADQRGELLKGIVWDGVK